MAQPWTLVRAILDYRNARAAIELFNQGKRGVAELQKHKGLQRILLDLHRAQVGEGFTLHHVFTAMENMKTDEEDADE